MIGQLVLLASYCSAFTTWHRQRVHNAQLKTALNFLSPAMSGFIAKTFNQNEYEQIVAQTMKREKCTREEAEERYNYYLYDPNGYALIKMQEQLREKGYNSFEEMFIAENGQQAWDDRQRQLQAGAKQRQTNAVVIVSVLFAAFVAVQEYLKSSI